MNKSWNDPKSKSEWIWYSFNLGSIIYFAEQLVATFINVNFNNSYNPLLWTETSTRLIDTIPQLSFLFSNLSPIGLEGNHFLTLIFINITFWYLFIFKLPKLEPFWIAVIVYWSISIHEWFWYISDYLSYYIHGAYFNPSWLMGSITTIIEAIIIIFIFPYKFKIRHRNIRIYLSVVFALFVVWNYIGFPVTYDYTSSIYINNIYIHGLEIYIWAMTLLALIILQPFEIVQTKTSKLIQRFKK